MYSIVLLAALATTDQAPAHGWTKTYGYGAGFGPCYGAGYTGWPHYLGGWGLPYGGYWAGYACHGACGGYDSRAFGMHTPTFSPAPSTYAPIDGPSNKTKDDKEERKNEMKNTDNLKNKDEKKDTENQQARAYLHFELPQGATLYVDGTRIDRTDERNSFRTPLLEKGEQYYYELRVEIVRDGRTYVENRRVSLSAGDRIKTDFSTVGTTSGVATVSPNR